VTAPDPVSSRYARLNAGLTELVTALRRGGVHPDLVDQARELATEAHTVETAAMVRALTFYRDTELKTAGDETLKGYDPSEVMVKLVDRTNRLISDITPPGGL
jgi:hypothetical protein